MSKVDVESSPVRQKASKLQKESSKCSIATYDTFNDESLMTDDGLEISLRKVVETKRVTSLMRPAVVDKYRIQGILNHGMVGKVKKVLDTTSGKTFAMKVVRIRETASGADTIERAATEVQCMAKCSPHPHVVSFVDFMRTEKKLYIVMELAPRGDLFDLVEKHGPLSEHRAKRLFRQMMKAVHYIHINGIVHRDIKPENVLLDEYGRAVLCDFGMAMKWTPEDGPIHTLAGTVRCLPPECVRHMSVPNSTHHPSQAEIWSCGITLFYMLTGSFPFEGRTHDETMRNTLAKRYVSQVPETLSIEAKLLIQRMLAYDPELRPTAREVLEDPFTSGRRHSQST